MPGIPRVNRLVAARDFKYFIFDWDDNILHMPTRIHMEHLDEDGVWRPVTISTGLFTLARTDVEHYRAPAEGGWDAAFADFHDSPSDGGRQFLHDTCAALRRIREGHTPGPSYETFRRTLVDGRIFAIVTARGHAPETLRRAVRLFVESALSAEEREEMMANLRGYRAWLDGVTQFGTDREELDYYLSMCRFHAVTNPDFTELMEADPVFGGRLKDPSANERRPEMAKNFAITDFTEHVAHMLQRTTGMTRPVAIGFSDDDVRNIEAVSKYVASELSRRFPTIKFVVYDTSDPTVPRGRKSVISGQLNLPGA